MKNFKIAFLLGTLAVFSSCIEATKNEPIEANIKEFLSVDLNYSQGYIILKDSLKINKWLVQSKPQQSLDSFKTIGEVIGGKNFFKLPSKLFESSNRELVKIVGLKADNSVSFSTQLFNPNEHTPSLVPPGWPQLSLGCTWKCVGADYAWEINHWFDESNDAYALTLSGTYDYYDEDANIYYPHYLWMNESAFNSYCSSIGLPPYCTEPYGIHRIGPNSAGKYAIVKDLGSWENQSISTPFDNLQIGPADCTWDRNHVIDKLNSNNMGGAPSPLVSCSPAFEPDDSFNEPGGASGDCIGQVSFNGFDFWEYMGNYWECMEEAGWDTDWFDTFETIVFTDLNNSSSSRQVFDIKTSFNNKYEWLVKSSELKPSLYLIGFILKGGKYRYAIVESTKPIDLTPKPMMINRLLKSKKR